MWQVIVAIVGVIATAAGIWYSVRKSASASQDRDVALAREKAAQARASELETKALDDEQSKRKEDKENATKLDARATADFLRDSVTSGRKP